MNLELTSEEADALAAAVRSYVADLRMEVADTERLALRARLKQEEKLLGAVLAKLDAGSGARA